MHFILGSLSLLCAWGIVPVLIDQFAKLRKFEQRLICMQNDMRVEIQFWVKMGTVFLFVRAVVVVV